MSSLLTLYTDAELDDLVAQVKAAIPKVFRGQIVRVADHEWTPATLAELQTFGDALGRESAARSGSAARVVTCRPRRDPFGRGR